MGLVKAAPVTLGFLTSEGALLALMTEPGPWIRPLIEFISAPAYALTVYGAGVGMGFSWPWNTISVLVLAIAIDVGIGSVRAGVAGVYRKSPSE